MPPFVRLSRTLAPTTAAAPSSAATLGAGLLHRSGFIRDPSARAPTWLPLGMRVLSNIERLARQELGRIGAQEIATAHPWQRSSYVGAAMATLKQCQLSPRALPATVYQQIHRGAVFVVTLDETTQWAEASRARLEAAANNVMRQCAIPSAVADAGVGDDGAQAARIVWALTEERGDGSIAFEPDSGYAATADVAAVAIQQPRGDGNKRQTPLESILTPSARTVAEVADLLGVTAAAIVKTIVVVADGTPIAACVRGDRALSLTKLRRVLGADIVELANEDIVNDVAKCPPGFVGPVDSSFRIIADVDLRGHGGLVCGAGVADTHLRGVDLERDAQVEDWAELACARAGDIEPRSHAPYQWAKVRHLARIADHGIAPARRAALVLSDQLSPIVSSASIDIAAMMLGAAEHLAGVDGIAWPTAIAPFLASVSCLKATDGACVAATEALARELQARGITVVLDDRKGAPKAILESAALFGAPVRAAVGPRAIASGTVEIRARGAQDPVTVAAGDAARTIASLLDDIRDKERSTWT